MTDYSDILHIDKPVSKKHPPMDRENRAAQFAPFAALTGFGGVISESGRLTEEKREIDENLKNELDMKLARAKESGKKVTVTYFEPDHKKEGGRYKVVTGYIKRISSYAGAMVLDAEEGLAGINVSDIRNIEID